MPIVSRPISACYVGATTVQSIYVGSDLVFGPGAGGGVTTPSFIGVTTGLSTDNPLPAPFTFSHTQTASNKLLVLGVSWLRNAGVPTGSLTFNSAAPDWTQTWRYDGNAGGGQVIAGLWDSPASGSQTVGMTWSSSLTRHAVVFALDFQDLGDVLGTASDHEGDWGYQTGCSIAIPEENTMLVHMGIGFDTVALSTPWTATGMTRRDERETNENNQGAGLAAVATQANPAVGTRVIASEWTHPTNDRAFGVAICLSGASA